MNVFYDTLLRMTLSASLLLPCLSLADIAVVVNKESSVKTISQEEVRNIFLGKMISLPNGERVVPMDQAEGAPDRETFIAKVLQKTEGQLNSYWSRMMFSGNGRPPKAAYDSEEVLDVISKNPNVIAYIDSSKVDRRVRVVLTVK